VAPRRGQCPEHTGVSQTTGALIPRKLPFANRFGRCYQPGMTIAPILRQSGLRIMGPADAI
jgi:hypothetical protein